ETPGSSPVPFLIARSMFAAGMLTALAASIAVRRRGFPSGSPPPSRAAMVISLITLVNILPRSASVFAFFRLIVAHFECPLMVSPGGSTGASRSGHRLLLLAQSLHQLVRVL